MWHYLMSPIASDWAGPFRSRVVELEEALAVAEAHRREPIWKRQCQCAFCVDSGAGRPSWRRHLLFPRRTGPGHVVNVFNKRLQSLNHLRRTACCYRCREAELETAVAIAEAHRRGLEAELAAARDEAAAERGAADAVRAELRVAERQVQVRCGSKCEAVELYKLPSAL